MNDFSVYGMAIVPIILAMVELLKKIGVPKKLSPLMAVALGILSGFYYLAPGEPKKAIFLGIVSGLSAIGLWSGTKNTIEEFGNNFNQKIHRFTAVKAKSSRELKNFRRSRKTNK